MKRIIAFRNLLLLATLAIYSSNTFAQEEIRDSTKVKADVNKLLTASPKENKNAIRTAANLKSGTSQDVLSSFFKLGYSDLKDNHELKFSSSLFAVLAKTDTSLWLDTAYRHRTFSRNFTFGFTYGLDTNYKFKAVSLDLKYALINNRDKDLFSFGPGYAAIAYMRANKRLLDSASQIYFKKYRNRVLTEGRLVANFYAFTKNAKDRTKAGEMPGEYLEILAELRKLPQFQTASDPINFRDSLTSMYNTLAELMAKRTLWTVGTRLFSSPNNAISKANFNTEFLKGMTGVNGSMGLELDLKANWNIYDSTVVNKVYHRNTFAASAGINWIIYKSKDTQKSYVEFKPGLSYEKTFSGKYTDEKEAGFTGEGTLRFRITDDLWLPFQIKYDRNQGKVFGFLNITTNFDWLGKSKK